MRTAVRDKDFDDKRHKGRIGRKPHISQTHLSVSISSIAVLLKIPKRESNEVPAQQIETPRRK